jgi:hypothetical protein
MDQVTQQNAALVEEAAAAAASLSDQAHSLSDTVSLFKLNDELKVESHNAYRSLMSNLSVTASTNPPTFIAVNDQAEWA